MSLRHAVLGLLAEMDGSSGYDLMRMFEVSLANVWGATQSQLYGELAKLTADGFIEVVEEGPRGRKAHGVTAAGREELRRWLTETAPKAVRRDEVLLRVFFLGLVTPEQREEYLRGRAAELAERQAGIEAVEEAVSWGEDDLSRYGRLVMEYGKRFMAMRREWMEWALRELEDPPTSAR
ncbi:PadR family transcriptional regulator [Actinomadura sp. NEAU-AAG7]|uniref:PadR family transcriptional regulator n=1 Tax=Actinomadura sp. NEAU-AAG7 TaxID=2839640 RepID=UPI001BE4ACD0|nr:PadR family transcriptional regulator [Actinomadura sp. NEAU-AAG7]MBT2209220.1 PadR family transcriptional regulator [Actinomadura sp. NEAU-AAG7]